MIFTCQKLGLEELQKLADSNRHSVLIEGPSGCGKTYMAKQYANMLSVPDFVEVLPKVNDVRDAIDSCLQIENDVVLCIENLDKGVSGASYTILKSLEEPLPNMYIVITCTNINNVPDTIISRSTVVSTSPPVDSDIDLYARSVNPDKYFKLQNSDIWRCIRTFGDANIILNMSDEHLMYFSEIRKMCNFQDSVSNIVWKLGHFDDKEETPMELVIRYIMEIVNTAHVKKAGIECISDMMQRRIAKHAVLAKFVFECKYVE